MNEERRMMANPEIPGAQEEAAAEVAEAREGTVTTQATVAAPEVTPTRRQPADGYEPESERLPLLARVLLADFAVAVIALVGLFVIEVQRYGDASLHLRREAWGEDLAVLFGVSLVFGGVTFLLIRARHSRVAIVQAVVTALVLTAAITSAATGDPKPTPAEISTTTGTPGHPG